MNNPTTPNNPIFTYEIRTDPNGWKYAVVYKNRGKNQNPNDDIYMKWDFGTVFDEADLPSLVNDLNSSHMKESKEEEHNG